MPLDFTLKTYNLLLDALEKYKIFNVKRFFQETPAPHFAILRHDVDRFPKNAYRMARIEAERDISSTYYFRVNRDLDLRIVREICKLGHDIGYHYEVLSKAKGNSIQALDIFQKELYLLRSVCEIKTICRHGRPLSEFDNAILWREFSFQPYQILGDAGLSILNVPYYTDAGRSWDERNSIRDHSNNVYNKVNVRTSFDVIHMLQSGVHNNVYLNIHPERWSAYNLEWIVSNCLDYTFNIGKRLITKLR